MLIWWFFSLIGAVWCAKAMVPPTNVTAFPGEKCLYLSWTPPPDEKDVRVYIIYMGEISHLVSGAPPHPEFRWPSLHNLQLYTFTVAAGKTMETVGPPSLPSAPAAPRPEYVWMGGGGPWDEEYGWQTEPDNPRVPIPEGLVHIDRSGGPTLLPSVTVFGLLFEGQELIAPQGTAASLTVSGSLSTKAEAKLKGQGQLILDAGTDRLGTVHSVRVTGGLELPAAWTMVVRSRAEFAEENLFGAGAVQLQNATVWSGTCSWALAVSSEASVAPISITAGSSLNIGGVGAILSSPLYLSLSASLTITGPTQLPSVDAREATIAVNSTLRVTKASEAHWRTVSATGSSASIELAGGSLHTSSLTASGGFTLSCAHCEITVTRELRLAGPASLTGASTLILRSGSRVTECGTASTPVKLIQGFSVRVPGSATVSWESPSAQLESDFVGGGLDIDGTLNVPRAASGSWSLPSLRLSSTGVLEMEPYATAKLTGEITGSGNGTVQLASAAVLTVVGTAFEMLKGLIVRGSGTIKFVEGDFANLAVEGPLVPTDRLTVACEKPVFLTLRLLRLIGSDDGLPMLDLSCDHIDLHYLTIELSGQLPAIGSSTPIISSADSISFPLPTVAAPYPARFELKLDSSQRQLIAKRLDDHHGQQLHISVTKGKDHAGCGGTEQAPCASIGYALREIAPQIASYDTLLISPGVYRGLSNLDLSLPHRKEGQSPMRVTGIAGAAQTIIDCEGVAGHRAFLLNQQETATTIIEGLTLRNCLVTEGGAAVLLQNSSPLFRNCVFANNTVTAQGGGALLAKGSTARFEHCVLTANTAQGPGADGGAILADESSMLSLTDCMCTNNTAASEGGCLAGHAISLRDSTVAYNTAATGGGLHLAVSATTGPRVSHAVELSGSTFVSNLARNGGGGAVRLLQGTLASGVSLRDCTFVNNAARGTTGGGGLMGGALMISQAYNLSVSDCHFRENSAHAGGAIALEEGQNVCTFSRCTLTGNHASLDSMTGGGAVLLSGARAEFTQCRFRDNRASNPLGGGGVFFLLGASSILVAGSTVSNSTADAQSTSGGGVAFMRGGQLMLKDTRVEQSSAPAGGVVYALQVWAPDEGNGLGGASAVSQGTEIQIINSHIDQASAQSGGALYLAAGVQATVRDSIVSRARAEGDGGALYVQSSTALEGALTVINSTFADCSAGEGGKGGSIYSQGEATLLGSSFLRNWALAAGAVYFAGSTSVTRGCLFMNNTASRVGGALYYTSPDHCPVRGETNNTFINNRVDDPIVPTVQSRVVFTDDTRSSLADSESNDVSSDPASVTVHVPPTPQPNRSTHEPLALQHEGAILFNSHLILASDTMAMTNTTAAGFYPGVPLTLHFTVLDCWNQPLITSAPMLLHLPPSTCVLKGDSRVLIDRGQADLTVVLRRPTHGDNCTLTFMMDPAYEHLLPAPLTLNVRPCGPGLFVDKDGLCAACPANTYNQRENALFCLPCPSGAECPDGKRVESKVDHWVYRVSDGEYASHECYPGNCLEGNQCAPHRKEYTTNPLCDACEKGYSRLFNKCGECTHPNYLHVFLALMALLGYVLFLHKTVQRSAATVGIFLYFVQAYILYFNPFRAAAISPEIAESLGFSGGGGGMVLNICIVPLTFYTRHLLRLSLVPLSILLLGTVALVQRCLRREGFDSAPYRRTTVALSLASISSVTQAVFSTFSCIPIGDRYYLLSAPSIECAGQTYTLWRVFVICLFILMCIPVLVSPYFLLRAVRQDKLMHPHFRVVWGLLLENYYGPSRPTVYALTEVYLILRRIAVAAVYSFTAGQFVPLPVMHAVFLVIHLLVRPFKLRSDHYLELASLGLLAAIYNPGASLYLQVIVLLFILVVLGYLLLKLLHRRTGKLQWVFKVQLTSFGKAEDWQLLQTPLLVPGEDNASCNGDPETDTIGDGASS